MERLTQTSNSGGVAFTFDLDIICQPSEARKILNLATKLKEYEDLEEQGRLIKLPCKIGSVLYEINDLTGFITERDIDKIEIFECPTPQIFLTSGRYYRMSASRDFGRTVFATKSEAEAKLKELRGEEDESSN